MSLLYKEAFAYGLDAFADASITKRKIVLPNGERFEYYVSCAGTVFVERAEDYRGNIVPIVLGENYTVYHDCTNNMGELLAILNAVRYGHDLLKFNKATHLNIISDSKISIFGLRDWIFNWVKNSHNGIMYGSSGPVLNQRLILQIIYEIIINNDFIRFYHIRGHQKSKPNVLIESFSKENGFEVTDIDPRLPGYLIQCNDRVDIFSRDMLKEDIMKSTEPKYLRDALLVKKQGYIKPIIDMEDFINNLDIDKYRYLIGRN